MHNGDVLTSQQLGCYFKSVANVIKYNIIGFIFVVHESKYFLSLKDFESAFIFYLLSTVVDLLQSFWFFAN
jgi:hypothetical protein